MQPWDDGLNIKLLDGWDPRLRTVSFEPQAFGNFAGLAWPWLLCGVLITQKSRRALHIILLADLHHPDRRLGGADRLAAACRKSGFFRSSEISFSSPRRPREPDDGMDRRRILLISAASFLVVYAANFNRNHR